MHLWFAVEPDTLAVVRVEAATEWHARRLLDRVFVGAQYARRIPTSEVRRLLIADTHFGCRVFLNANGQVRLRRRWPCHTTCPIWKTRGLSNGRGGRLEVLRCTSSAVALGMHGW